MDPFTTALLLKGISVLAAGGALAAIYLASLTLRKLRDMLRSRLTNRNLQKFALVAGEKLGSGKIRLYTGFLDDDIRLIDDIGERLSDPQVYEVDEIDNELEEAVDAGELIVIPTY